MPEAAHKALLIQAKKKHLTGDRKDAYVYGTLQRLEKKMHAKKTHNPLRID